MMVDKNTGLVQYQAPSLAEMKQDFAALVGLRDILSKGIDYGTIPGCGDKPTLLKPGAEKVLKRFMVHVVDIEVEDLSTADCVHYRIRCIGQTPDGITRGVGIGECSSDEDKYRWRKSVGDAEYNDTVDERRRIKHKWGKGGSTYTVKQVRTNPADYANTALKIGKKRAFVDLALSATAASEFFTQDIEDMDEEMQAQVAAERSGRPADPFAPPPIDVDAETVDDPPADDPPPRMSPKRQVWERAKELGLGGEDVKAVIAEDTGLPDDANKWTVVDVGALCEALEARAKAKDKAADETRPRPGNHHYEEAEHLAAGLGATKEEWQAALAEAFGEEGVAKVAWNEGHTDAVIAILERMKGA